MICLKCYNKKIYTIFITGDFSINTSDAIINPNINVNNFKKYLFYTPLIDKPTRVDKMGGGLYCWITFIQM